VEATGDVPVEDEHQWMTLGQIQRLLNVPNLVSMDARTVLSCIPLAVRGASRLLDSGKNPLAVSPFGTALLESMTESGGAAHNDEQILGWLTDLKCRHQLRVERLATKSLQGWTHGDDRIVHDAGRYFEVMAVHVEGVNREVASWDQPLVAPVERGLIGFAVQRIGGVLHFLVQGKIEPGNLDVVAVAPTVQCALGAEGAHDASCRPPFLELMDDAGPGQLRYSCIQSEEGGRFYHVENEYRVVELPAAERLPLPENYTWVTLRQLTELLRFGLVNVEARSLLACLQLVD
jgi:oxidase EvaA